MSKNIPALKRGFSYRQGTAGSGGLGIYTDGLLIAEYENYNDQLMITYGKSLTGVPQGIYEESATKNYPIGTKRIVDDMTFHYCAARTEPTTGTSKSILASRAVANTHSYVTASTVVAANAGATSITATVAGTATNAYENGYILQQPSPWTHNQKIRIKSNTTTVYTTKDPLEQLVNAADNLFFSKNMYASCGKTATDGSDYAHREYRRFVAVPLLNVTSAYYFWGQTWGPCCIQFESSTYLPGGLANVYGTWRTSTVFFDDYGAVSPGGEEGTAPYNCGCGTQEAGFVIPDTYTAGADGWSILIYLQIAP